VIFRDQLRFSWPLSQPPSSISQNLHFYSWDAESIGATLGAALALKRTPWTRRVKIRKNLLIVFKIRRR
jgi:hypothetical protein